MPESTTTSKCIAIGDYACATKPLEMTIRVTGYELRTILTEEEFDTISSVICRMEVKKFPEEELDLPNISISQFPLSGLRKIQAKERQASP